MLADGCRVWRAHGKDSAHSTTEVCHGSMNNAPCDPGACVVRPHPPNRSSPMPRREYPLQTIRFYPVEPQLPAHHDALLSIVHNSQPIHVTLAKHNVTRFAMAKHTCQASIPTARAGHSCPRTLLPSRRPPWAYACPRFPPITGSPHSHAHACRPRCRGNRGR